MPAIDFAQERTAYNASESGRSRIPRTACLLPGVTTAPILARFYWHLLAGLRRLFGVHSIRSHHRLTPTPVLLQYVCLSRGRAYRHNEKLFDRWLSRKPQPLTGAPATRRQKTYSGQSGYVYQYYYEGHRPYKNGRHSGTEYVFAVSADRKTSMAVSVLVRNEAVDDWQSRHGRTLYASERYAIAKLALFQAFDERPNPAAMSAAVEVRAADVEAILITLAIE